MPYSSLEDFIKAADAIGEVEYVEGADLERDVGCLTELSWVSAAVPCPSSITSRVIPQAIGFAQYHQVDATFLSRAGFAPRHSSPGIAASLARQAQNRRAHSRQGGQRRTDSRMPSRRRRRKSRSFPAPLWHPGDGGRYIGTADNVIVGDPDQGWINVGVYRGMVQSRNRMSLWINPMKHGRILVERHWSKGQAAPVAVVLGCEPVTWMSGSMSPPLGTSEYDMAGSFRGAPVEIVSLPLTGLPVPAGADLVVEGFIPPITEETARGSVR